MTKRKNNVSEQSEFLTQPAKSNIYAIYGEAGHVRLKGVAVMIRPELFHLVRLMMGGGLRLQRKIDALWEVLENCQNRGGN